MSRLDTQMIELAQNVYTIKRIEDLGSGSLGAFSDSPKSTWRRSVGSVPGRIKPVLGHRFGSPRSFQAPPSLKKNTTSRTISCDHLQSHEEPEYTGHNPFRRSSSIPLKLAYSSSQSKHVDRGDTTLVSIPSSSARSNDTVNESSPSRRRSSDSSYGRRRSSSSIGYGRTDYFLSSGSSNDVLSTKLYNNIINNNRTEYVDGKGNDDNYKGVVGNSDRSEIDDNSNSGHLNGGVDLNNADVNSVTDVLNLEDDKKIATKKSLDLIIGERSSTPIDSIEEERGEEEREEEGKAFHSSELSAKRMASEDGVLNANSTKETIEDSSPTKLNPCLRVNSMPFLRRNSRESYENARETMRLEKFSSILSQSQVNIDELRKLSWSGIPKQVRPMTWMLLSGYLPAKQSRREATLERKRREYQGFVTQYFATHHHSEENEALHHQITIDIPRTDPNIQLFQQKVVQEIYLRILYTWAIRHPASGYVQGINDLLTPFFFVFLEEKVGSDFYDYDVSSLPKEILDPIEADSFWCMSKLLDRIHDNYVCSQPGIQRKVNQLAGLVSCIDEPLHNHLHEIGVNYLDFAFRWMNCLLIRELPYPCVTRMFDTYHAEADDFSELHLYVCVAFLIWWSQDIRKQEDFHDAITLIQNASDRTLTWTDKEIGIILAEAFVWKAMYQNSSHLQKSYIKPS